MATYKVKQWDQKLVTGLGQTKKTKNKSKQKNLKNGAKLSINVIVVVVEWTHWSTKQTYDYTNNNKKPATMKKINEFAATEGYIGRSEYGTTNSTRPTTMKK